MIQDIKDEILESSPSYTIRDKDGNIVQDDVDITLKTPVVQEGTPLNRATLANLQGDLYTQDRYTTTVVEREIVPVDYVTDIVISEERFAQNCIPQSGWIANTTGTSYTSGGVTISSANYRGDGYEISTAFDGDMNTMYHTSNDGVFSVIIQFSKPTKITKMKIAILMGGSATDYVIKGSNNGTNYADIYTGVESSALSEIEMTQPGYYTYYRISEGSTASGYSILYELEVSEYYEGQFGKYEYIHNINLPLTSYEKGKIINIESGSFPRDETTKQGNIVPTSGWTINSTSYSENENGVRISSSISSNYYEIWNACDGNADSYFRTDGTESTISLTYTFPYKVKVTKMKLKQKNLGSSTSITISAGNDMNNLITLFTGTGEYTTIREVELSGDLGYYKYYRLTLSGGDYVPQVYEWTVSEIQGIEFDEFANSYININGLGKKQINGKTRSKEKYSLTYNGETWEFVKHIISGQYADRITGAERVFINLGFKPKLVIITSATGATTPQFIDELSTTNRIEDNGFSFSFSTASGHSLRYIAMT